MTHLTLSFIPETPGNFCPSACLDLLNVIGMGLSRDTIKGFQPLLQPGEWRTNGMKTNMEPE
jgi:hypothetical protein